MTSTASRTLLYLGVLTLTPIAAAQELAPSPVPKLIRIVVPFSAGASNDAIARAIAQPLARRLETSVIVENKPGAAGTVGADFVAKAPRDGSVLLLTSSTFLTSAATQPRLPYDLLAAFTPVATVGQNPSLLAVSAATPFKSASELFAAARSKPNFITYGSAGVGSIGHMVTELMNAAAKVSMVHVPYKGAANAAIDLAGGQIYAMISSQATLAPLIRTGKVRVLAVTSREPHPSFPQVPPLSATLPGFSSQTWVGVFAPSGTPAPFVERLNREIGEIAGSAAMRKLLEPDGILPVAATPAEFAARVKQELAQWKQVVVTRKIQLE